MPYIKREEYARAARLPISAGELNYAITFKIIDYLETGSTVIQFYDEVTKICESYINRRGENYTVMNEVVGALACSAMEARRRCKDIQAVNRITDMLADVCHHIYNELLVPYEDVKIKENGDVYPKELIG